MRSLRNGQRTGQPPPLRPFDGDSPDTPPKSGRMESFWSQAPGEADAEAKPFSFGELPLVGEAPEPPPVEGEAGEEPPRKAEPPELETPERAAKLEEMETRLEKAQSQAEEILRDAKRQAVRIRDSAEEKGRREGYDAGFISGAEAARKEQEALLQQRVTEALKDVERAVRQLESEQDRLLAQHLDGLRELTLAIAEKVINVSLKSSGDIIEKMIVAATDRSKRQEWAKVYIAKHDAEMMVRGDKGILQAMANVCTNVKVEVMDNGRPGDCIIEFPDQIIDAGVKTQLDNIKEIMQADNND